MCGITGFVDFRRATPEADLRAQIERMTRTLTHRGPDDEGLWTDAAAGVALGHRRLSIVDLSAEGHQPMVSATGRYVIVYNGEVYNFRELRAELEPLGHRFRGHSDTEVMLAAFTEWGFEASLARFNGMFAIALWDREARRLRLARDRIGIKPLFYGRAGGKLLLGSELKALVAHPAADFEIDRGALALYLRHNYVPAPLAIYAGVRKLPPGTWLEIDVDAPDADPEPRVYWSAVDEAARGARELTDAGPDEIVEALDQLLRSAVAYRMIADVPLGAFLSGGIDSSTVVALMQAQSDRPVRTFTIGFKEDSHNEAEHARAVAAHLGTDHTELYVTPEEAMAVVPRLPVLYDEPFSDSSQIPTFLVSQLARRHVTVSLSGDGGDELYGGYHRYATGADLWRLVGWMPRGLRRAGGRALGAVPRGALDRTMGWTAAHLTRYGRAGAVGDKLHKAAEILAAGGPEDLYRMIVSHWKDPERVVLGGREPTTRFDDRAAWARMGDFRRTMMAIDLVTYLPDDILTKLDRATMGVALEGRVPLLDHRSIEFAQRVPVDVKRLDGRGKWPLRQVLYRYVPRELVERPKMGFGVPIAQWLRGPMREWADALLDEGRLGREGFFDPAPIREKWREHLSGARNWQYYLWDVLMFQAWLEAR